MDKTCINFLKNNNWWITIRSIEVQELRQNVINTVYSPIISEETKKFLLHQYLNSQGVIAVNPVPNIRTAFTKILTTIIFGRTALDSDNIRIYTLLMDTIFNQKLISRVKKRLLVHGEDSENCLIANVMKFVKVDLNFIADSTTHQFEKDQDGNYILDRYDLMTICIDMMVGGIRTTVSSLIWLYALLAKFPRVQKKIQDELDLVVSKGKSSIRFLVPHGNTEEDIYRGYHIPTKSTILISTFSINMEPLLYENPENFCPERFLDEKEHLKNSEEYHENWATYHNLFTFANYTMSMFTLQIEKDPITGKPIDLDIDTVCGNDFDCKPLDYKLIFKPREGFDVLSELKVKIFVFDARFRF
ncbi:hypothetical protein G9A89_005373 [Geosiphon pyriformis]|nr:hypothetical protein G9A89_005373 [Geosiphon pyriformis]